MRGGIMLKRIGQFDETGAAVPIASAAFPAPFASGLEYSAPARGVWNIVHTGMLIPGAHEIFVCAANCLRGVVLTAAEMGMSDRFSTITIKENNVLDGNMEELIIEGVTDILNKLPSLPPAVLLYTSCIHHFMGCDTDMCYAELRRRFPQVDFTDCYMNPIMRKSGLTPDQLMRRQLYSLLKPVPLEPKTVNIVGNNFSTADSSELCRLIRRAGWALREITRCASYEEYQQMSRSAMNISYIPAARAAADALQDRLGQPQLYLPLSFNPDKISRELNHLAVVLGIDYDDTADRAEAMQALERAKDTVGDMPIAIDYTAVPTPLGLARLLLEHGFAVTRLYADSFRQDERDEFDWLCQNAPELKVYATVQVKMRVMPRTTDGPMLAIGQKAAYFTGTNNFVDIVEGAGMYGFDGIRRMAGLMEEAVNVSRNAAACIQQKGWGCSCCI